MRSKREPQFFWDDAKAQANERKHGITFKLAASVFGDELAEILHDVDHGDSEDRWVIFGATDTGVLLTVIHTYYGSKDSGHVRIISARKMTARERREYESGEYTIREPEMPSEYDEVYEKAEGEWDFDFSKAVRGYYKYWRFPISIDNEVLGYFHGRAIATGVSTTEQINAILRRHVGLPPDTDECTDAVDIHSAPPVAVRR